MKLKNIKYHFKMKQLLNYFKYKTSKKAAILSYRPIWLLIYVSDLCNLRCEMCPHHNGKTNDFLFQKNLTKEFMTPEMLEKIYQKFPESIFVMLGGVGEPLINPYFKDLVRITAKNRKKMNLITNGVLLNEEMTDYLLLNKYVNQISVSLNASTAEEYISICKINKFDEVCKNIRYLIQRKKELKSNVEIVVSGVCSHQFVDKSIDFLKFCDSLNVDRIDLHRYIDFDVIGGLTDIDEMHDDMKKIADCANKLHTKTNLPHSISKKTYKKACDWYFKNLSFDAKGNMGSCGRVINPDKKYGNIDDEGDIWNNEYMQMMRSRFLEPDDVVTKYCEKCVENHLKQSDNYD